MPKEGGEGADGTVERMEISFPALLLKEDTERREDVVEKSLFPKDVSTGRWLYRDAEIDNPFKNIEPVVTKNMVTTNERGVGKGK